MRITDRYKSFPPGWNHLKIPISSSDAALAGLAMYSACRPTGIWLHRAAWLWVRLLGPRALPGRAVAWEPPMEGAWLELAGVLEAALGPFDAIAGYLRAAAAAAWIALLLLRGGAPVAFVKVRYGESDALATEERAMRAVSASVPLSFRVPSPLLSGNVAGWRYLAVSPIPVQRHLGPHESVASAASGGRPARPLHATSARGRAAGVAADAR